MRECSHCRKPLSSEELAREESKGMEAERKELGLQGVRFLYYNCSGCGYADIFVDVHPIEGETAAAFRERRQELESAVRQLHADRIEVIVTEK
jgi:hypothetical protein